MRVDEPLALCGLAKLPPALAHMPLDAHRATCLLLTRTATPPSPQFCLCSLSPGNLLLKQLLYPPAEHQQLQLPTGADSSHLSPTCTAQQGTTRTKGTPAASQTAHVDNKNVQVFSGCGAVYNARVHTLQPVSTRSTHGSSTLRARRAPSHARRRAHAHVTARSHDYSPVL